MIHHTSKSEPIFTDRGIVMGGSNIARLLGFPTANLPLKEPELSGTYAGEVLVDTERYPAAVYADPERELLESHLLDFDGDLYGKEITVFLYEKVMPAGTYADDQALREGVAQAVAKVRDYFGKKLN